MSTTSVEPSPFAMALAKGIEEMISTKESRAVLDQYAKIQCNPALGKQLEEVSKCLEHAIDSNKTFCYVDQPLLPPTSTMLKGKGYDVQTSYDYWSDVSDEEQRGFYIDIFPGASTKDRKNQAAKKKEQERKTLEFAKLLSKGEGAIMNK